MRRLGLLTVVAAIGVAALVVGVGVRTSTALFSDQETTTASSATAGCFVNDAAAPTVTASIVSKTAPSYIGGFVKQAGTYYVYANISGAATRVTADVRPLTPGQFLAPLTAGAYTAGGVAYGWRSAALTVGNPLAAGGYAYSVSAANAALQCRTASSTVTVDNTAPAATDVQTVSAGAIIEQPDLGDQVTFSFSEVVDPESISSGWTGTSRNVVVRIQDIGSGDDTLTVWNSTNSVQLPFGSVDLDNNFVTADTTYGASGTPSTIVQSGTTITVTLGTMSGSPRKGVKGAMVWTPSAAVTDRAGNASSTTPVTETGVNDIDF